MSYAFFQLKCPDCGLEYSQVLPDDDSREPICPSCDSPLELKKLSGKDIISCGINIGGG